MSEASKPRAASVGSPSRTNRRKRSADPLPTGALKGAGIGLFSLFLLSALFAGIAAGCENPGILYLPFSLCALYLGAVAAGFSSARASGRSFLSGLSAGGLYALGVFLLALLPLPSSGLPASAYWVLLVTTIPAAALGGVMGQRKKGKGVRRR